MVRWFLPWFNSVLYFAWGFARCLSWFDGCFMRVARWFLQLVLLHGFVLDRKGTIVCAVLH